MKKHIVILMVVCMLFAALPTAVLSAEVGTTTADPNLIFDMDLSDCTASNPQQVKDKSGANMVDNFGYRHWKNDTSYDDSATYDKVSYGMVEGKDTPYLTFADYNSTTSTVSNGKSVLHVNFKASEIQKRNIANANAVTIETWAKLDEDGQNSYAQLFQFGCNSHNMTSSYIFHTSFSAQFNTKGTNNISFYPDRAAAHRGAGAEASFTLGEDCGGKWAHYVFVREWTAQNKWKITLYINGKKVSEQEKAETGRTNYTVPLEDEAIGDTAKHYPTALMIGCIENRLNNRAVAGSIATFKLYDDARTAQEVEQDYKDSKANFFDPVPILESISFKNQNGAVIDDETVLLEDATKVAVTAKITDCPDSVAGFMAIYGEKGVLEAVIPATVGRADSNGVTEMTATVDTNKAHRVALYVWKNTSTIVPVIGASSIGGKVEPLVITAEFCDGSGQPIEYAKGKTEISAKLNLSAGEPPENLKANLKLIRNKEVIYKNSADIVFNNGQASVSLAYVANAEYAVLPTLQVDDELVLTVTDGAEALFEKRLHYEDQSKIVDVILVAGQSNALGQGGNATISIKPDADTVYYNTMGNKTLSTSGNQGWDSALAKTWHEETGRTVLLVKATWGGTGFPTIPDIDSGNMYATGSRYYGLWNPDNGMPLENTSSGATSGKPDTFKPRNCYTHAKNAYNAAIASIDTDEYTIGRKIYFWNQGENENGSYTPAQYKEAFLEMHDALKTDLGLEYAGILPVRSTILSSPPTGAENTRSAETTLRLTGPRIAQYNLGTTRNDVFIVADTMERWSSDANIKKWFEDKYPNGYYAGEENMPKNWSGIMATDNIHYNQYALNEFGPEAAKNMLNFIRGGGKSVDGIDLITPFGIEHIENGGTISLPAKDGTKETGDGWNATLNGVIPVMPASSGIKGTFTLSGTTAAELTAEGLLVPKACIAGDYSTLTVSYTENGVPKTMSFRVESPIKETSVVMEIAPVFENRSAIYTLTTDDGYYYTTEWLTKKLAEIETEKGLSANTLKATMGLVPKWIDDTVNNVAGKKAGIMTWTQAQSYAALPRWGVANHTQNHTQAGFNTLSEEVLKQEINGGRATLKSYFPNEKIVGLYTPGGHNNDLIRKVASEQHFSLRVVGGSYNQLPLTDTINTTAKTMYNLVAPTVDEDTTAAEANGWVDSAISSGKGWLIECWHCVGTDVGWSPVPEAIAEAHLEYVADKAKAGQLWVTTLDEASVYAKQRLYTRLSLKTGTDVAGGKIVFGIEDDLDDILYDATLTVNITLPAGWSNATATQGGESIPVTIANGKLSVNSLPDQGDITITKVS